MAKKRNAHTRVELTAIILILAVVTLSAVTIPRMSRNSATARTRTCRTNMATINTQLEAYYSENSSWPASATHIMNDPNYFPKGAPSCPAGGNYSIDDVAHRVSCSIHDR